MTKTVTRYVPGDGWTHEAEMSPCDAGDWVRYDDHVAAIEAERRVSDSLRAALKAAEDCNPPPISAESPAEPQHCATCERLRAELADPPADVQEAVLRKLNLWPPPARVEPEKQP